MFVFDFVFLFLTPAVSIGINARTYWAVRWCQHPNALPMGRKDQMRISYSPPSTTMLLPSYSSRQCHATCEHMGKHMHEFSNGPTEDERDEDE